MFHARKAIVAMTAALATTTSLALVSPAQAAPSKPDSQAAASPNWFDHYGTTAGPSEARYLQVYANGVCTGASAKVPPGKAVSGAKSLRVSGDWSIWYRDYLSRWRRWGHTRAGQTVCYRNITFVQDYGWVARRGANWGRG